VKKIQISITHIRKQETNDKTHPLLSSIKRLNEKLGVTKRIIFNDQLASFI
jgi:hypothetical protein